MITEWMNNSCAFPWVQRRRPGRKLGGVIYMQRFNELGDLVPRHKEMCQAVKEIFQCLAAVSEPELPSKSVVLSVSWDQILATGRKSVVTGHSRKFKENDRNRPPISGAISARALGTRKHYMKIIKHIVKRQLSPLSELEGGDDNSVQVVDHDD